MEFRSMFHLVLPDEHLLAGALGVLCISNKFQVVLHGINGFGITFLLAIDYRQVEPSVWPSGLNFERSFVMPDRRVQVPLFESVLSQ